LDSLGILDVVSFLETEFSMVVSDDELVPEKFPNAWGPICFRSEKDREGRMSLPLATTSDERANAGSTDFTVPGAGVLLKSVFIRIGGATEFFLNLFEEQGVKVSS